jgi:hypothetical protein
MGFVYTQTVLRFVMAGVLVLMKQPLPYRTFPNIESARRWAEQVLASHGLRRSPSSRLQSIPASQGR